MTLEEIYTLLGKVENGPEIGNTIKSELTKLRNEAAENRIDKQNVEKMLKELNISADDTGKQTVNQLKSLMEQLAADHKTPGDVNAQITAMRQNLKELTDKLTASEQKAQAAEAQRIDTAKNAELINVLTDAKAVSPSQIAKILFPSVKAKDDGKFYLIGEDGKELTVKDGVTNYLKNNTWAVNNTANPGGGTHPPAADGQPDYENMSEADYFKARDAELLKK